MVGIPNLNEELIDLINVLSRCRQINSDEYLKNIYLLVNAVEQKDNYTARHTERVTLYSLVLFDELKNNSDIFKQESSDDYRRDLKISSLLHDVGKIGVRTEILAKPGPLTGDEFKEMMRHPEYGYVLAIQIGESQRVLAGIRNHHERYDGKGYPDGLYRENIPFIAEIISVADAYDAMTSDRPYRKALPREAAHDELLNNCGTQFNPLVIDAFKSCYSAARL